MTKTKRLTFTYEFKKEAVRLMETSGRTLPQVAKDLRVGLSSLSRWKQQLHDADLMGGPHQVVTKDWPVCVRKTKFCGWNVRY